MFRLRKEKGYNKAITVYNPDSKKSVNIGIITSHIMDILKEAGFTFDMTEKDTSSYIDYTGEWDLSISEELGRKLAEQALAMKRPPKVNKDKPAEKNNEEIDAWDVLLGLASYKKGE